ncbi:MAG: glycosyltransferase family 4 protein [Cetobacterium sp.]
MKRNKILYLHQYFNTNNSTGGTRSYEFSKYLSKDNDVIVITGKKIEQENSFGVKIVSTNTKYDQKMSFFLRIYSFFHYVVMSIFLGIREENVDIIFATSTPLTIGIPALILKKLKNTKLIFEVRDVWPDVPIELGFIKNKLLIKILKWFELCIYKNSDYIIVASEGMCENLLKKGIKKNKIEIIHNLSNTYLYKDITIDQTLKQREKYSLGDKFICIHPGTMGFVNGLDYVLEVGKSLQEKDEEILILLVGDGKEKSILKKKIDDEKIKNIKIIDALPKLEIVQLIKASNLGLMITKKFKILEDNSANKFFDFLAAELPIVINYGGWQKKVLENSKSGFGCSPDSPEDMAEKILFIKNSPNYMLMKKNAFELAEKNYSTKIACEKLNQIIKELDKNLN